MLTNLIKIGILIDFKLNQDFIAEFLCINKDKPKKLCNGKCYLSEQLKKAGEQEEKEVPAAYRLKLEVLYFYSKTPLNIFKKADNYLNKLNSSYKNKFYGSSYVADFFRPPKFILI